MSGFPNGIFNFSFKQFINYNIFYLIHLIMCGINGFTFSNIDLVKKMKEYTKRRGPDADGIYVSDEVTISHDRLSIIDLSNEV